jgi:2-(1,2-epoxy-1,2-dihydrophenyl)acetyl-CoA isomerase
MTEPTIILDMSDGTATITLNRPDKLNAFTEAMHGEFAHALDRIELDRSIRAVILTGAGRGFCAGHDLSDRSICEDDNARRSR